MSSWPTGSQLDAIRAQLDAMLDGTASIISYTPVSDGLGGWTNTPSGTAIVACDVWQTAFNRDERRMVGNRVVQIGERVFTFAADTAVTTSDQIVFEGVAYEVVDVIGPLPNEWERRVITVEIS